MPKQKVFLLTNYKENDSKYLTRKVENILIEQDFEVVKFDVEKSPLEHFKPTLFSKVITCVPLGDKKLPSQKEAFMSSASGLSTPDVQCITCVYSQEKKEILFHPFRSGKDYSDTGGFTSPHLV